MKKYKFYSFIVFFINAALLVEATWTAEGRISLRFYKETPTTFLDEPMEKGLRIFSDPHYNTSRPLVIIIHGMDANVDCEFVEGSVKAMYFRDLNKQFNIIALNLPELLAKQNIYDNWLYTTAKNSKIAGEALGRFMNTIIQLKYTVPDQIYVVGYSMGAQVAGYMARTIKTHHGLIQYIAGLDPAGTGFRASTLTAWFTGLVHVSSADAKYTHFIHCNSLAWGTLSRNATANFIFNGAYMQPGCIASTNLACSHQRVPYYFIESILFPEGFPSQQCKSWRMFSACKCALEDVRYFKFPPDLEASGIYFLRTNGHSPFGKGEHGISCVKDDSHVPANDNKIDSLEDQEETSEEKEKHRTTEREYVKTQDKTEADKIDYVIDKIDGERTRRKHKYLKTESLKAEDVQSFFNGVNE